MDQITRLSRVLSEQEYYDVDKRGRGDSEENFDLVENREDQIINSFKTK
jgi:hypothetical protein